MSHTFEELVSPEIDGLYHGALFLNGGDREQAEGLLVRAVGAAFHRFGEVGEAAGVQSWLEERLVRTFVGSGLDAAGIPPAPAMLVGAPALSTQDLDLHAAASDVPPLARAALWLVLLRRWPHADAASALKVSPEVLRDLLMYRHTLLAAMMADGSTGHGKDRHVVT